MTDRDITIQEGFIGVVYEQQNTSLGFGGRFPKTSLKAALKCVHSQGFWEKGHHNLKSPMAIRCIGRLIQLLMVRQHTAGDDINHLSQAIDVMVFAAIGSLKHPFCWANITEIADVPQVANVTVLRGLTIEINDIAANNTADAQLVFSQMESVKKLMSLPKSPGTMDAFSPVAGSA